MGNGLSTDIAGWLLVFARVGSITMLLPGFGDEAIPVRIKLIFALLLALVIYPAVFERLPEAGSADPLLAGLVVHEVVVGLMMGALIRIFYSAIATAGTIISMQSGLAMAIVFDPTLGGQTTALTRFLNLLAVVVIFALNLHHLFIAATVRSYTALPVAGTLAHGDFAELAVRAVSAAFAMGVQLAAPFLIYGLIFNTALGFVARLAPAVQVFFVAQPLNLLLAFGLLLATIGLMMAVYGDYLAAAVHGLIG